MKNYYSTVDNIVLTFSDIEEKNGFDEITVYFERPNYDGLILLKVNYLIICFTKHMDFQKMNCWNLKDI